MFTDREFRQIFYKNLGFIGLNSVEISMGHCDCDSKSHCGKHANSLLSLCTEIFKAIDFVLDCSFVWLIIVKKNALVVVATNNTNFLAKKDLHQHVWKKHTNWEKNRRNINLFSEIYNCPSKILALGCQYNVMIVFKRHVISWNTTHVLNLSYFIFGRKM